MNRDAVRQRLKKERLNIAPDIKQKTAIQFVQQLSKNDLFKQAENIGCYFAVNGEADTSELIQYFLQKNKNVYLPKLQADNHLIFAHYDDHTVVEKNKFGILEPATQEKIINATQLDIVFVPIVAFDKNGNRLCRGAGYYDRTFDFKNKNPQSKPLLIGLAYEFQKTDEITTESWDVKLDGVITEKNSYLFK